MIICRECGIWEQNVIKMYIKKRRVFITDENESSYYVKPLGKSEVKEGWVNKKDVKLLREMIRN